MLDTCSLEIPLPRIGAEPPKEFRIFSWGLNLTKKGPVYLTKEGAKQIIDTYKKDGHALVFDKDHRMINPNASADDIESQGYFRLDLRDDGIWAVDIEWVPEAAKKISEGKWGFFSPAVWKTRLTNVLTKVLNIALTNLPATQGIKPLLLSQDLLSDSEGGMQMDEMLMTKVKPLRQMMGASASLMSACKLAIEGGYDGPMKDLAQKINSMLPDWIEAAAEMMEQLDPEGKTMPDEEEMKMSTADVIQEEAQVVEKVVEPVVAAEAPVVEEIKKDGLDELYALCKELTGKENFDEIRGLLRAMKHNQKVAEEQLSMAQKKNIISAVEKGIERGLIRPAEKEIFVKLSQAELDTFLLSATPIVSFDSVYEKPVKLGVSGESAQAYKLEQEALERILKKVSNKGENK